MFAPEGLTVAPWNPSAVALQARLWALQGKIFIPSSMNHFQGDAPLRVLLRMELAFIEQNGARLRLPCKEQDSVYSRGLCGRPLDSFALRMSKVLGRLLIDYYANCRGLSGRPLHPFGAPSDEDGFCRKKRVRKALDFLHLIYCAYSRGLCGYESKTPPSGLLRRPFG